MKLVARTPLVVLVFVLSCFAQAAAQDAGTPLRIVEVGPYDRAAPGLIMELRVDGFSERLISPPPGGELRIQLTQDSSTQTASARTASPVLIRERPASGGDTAAAPSMKAYQGITFVVPRGLHAGEAEVVVVYRKQRSAPFRLNIVERPLPPVVGSTGVMTIAPASLPLPPRPGDPVTRARFGLKFERGARHVEMHVRPLPDPTDAESAVLVRFKQGGTFYDTEARVIHQERKDESLSNGGMRFMPSRDVMEVDVPELLAPGEAEIEVRLRAAGQTSDAVLVPVTITDAERAYEAPKETAPRMLAVTPSRVGAGQAVMISVDRRRALDPDPSKARIVFEGPDGTRRTLKPESNSAVLKPDTPPDAPVLLIVRAPEGMVGTAQVRLFNPARADYEGASSEPAQVELVAEPQPPDVLGVSESTQAELSQIRQMAEAMQRAGRQSNEYDPSARYVTIRANGLEYNPRFLRVRMEQEGRAPVTLGPGDFALFSNGSVIVRVPKELDAGRVRLSVENRGATAYSVPVVKTFELSAKTN
ncbi:MAG: hypothetical protein QOE46_2996 [Acidobacteriota bacterium]|jgi:hypothetical protein|nr:hypothetical protein [Acidobacteriota bacterium]